ncbi:hypothetical protein MASR1M90_20250 [Desulfovibrionales bacterium]
MKTNKPGYPGDKNIHDILPAIEVRALTNARKDKEQLSDRGKTGKFCPGSLRDIDLDTAV